MLRKLTLFAVAIALLVPSSAQACNQCAQAAIAQGLPQAQVALVAAQPAVALVAGVPVCARALTARETRKAARQARRAARHGSAAVGVCAVSASAVVGVPAAAAVQVAPQLSQVQQQYRLVPVIPDEAPTPADATAEERATAQAEPVTPPPFNPVVPTPVPVPVAPPSPSAFEIVTVPVTTYAYRAAAVSYAPAFTYTAAIMPAMVAMAPAYQAVYMTSQPAFGVVGTGAFVGVHAGRHHILPYRNVRP